MTLEFLVEAIFDYGNIKLLGCHI